MFEPKLPMIVRAWIATRFINHRSIYFALAAIHGLAIWVAQTEWIVASSAVLYALLAWRS